jgi:protein phosphatase
VSRRRTEPYAGLTHVGLVRAGNEDALGLAPPVFVVADGLGGHQAGEVASGIAVDTVLEHAPDSTDPRGLGQAARDANAAVIEATRTGRGREGMGTTLTAAVVRGTRITLAHVGDSRAYLLTQEGLTQLTQDHSVVADMVRDGLLSREEALVHPSRSVITRALGTDPDMQPDVLEVSAQPGDRLLLCSDGVHGMVPDSRIEDLLASAVSPQAAVKALVDASLAAGGQDNATAVVVEIVPEDPARPSHRRRAAPLIWVLTAVLLVGAVGFGTLSYARSRAFVTSEDGLVTVYRGLPGAFAGISLSWREQVTEIEVGALPTRTADRLAEGVTADDLEHAMELVSEYRAMVSGDTTPAAE